MNPGRNKYETFFFTSTPKQMMAEQTINLHRQTDD
jgi:hypothetical protein